MSIFKKIQNAFGFGFPDDEDFKSEEFAINERTNTIPNVVNNDPDAKIEVPEHIVHQIFDKVVEVTNASIPQYFSSSVNVEKQKKFLYDSLDASIRQYIESLEVQAQNKCMALWQSERDELKKEMENLKQKSRDLENKKAEIHEQKLSAERQKRALSERVHDLENTINKLEAEKEQYEIENRSLLNKAKVANVYEADIQNLQNELTELKKKQNPAMVDAEKQSLIKQVADLQAEINRLNEAGEVAKVKNEMEDAMFNDLQKRAAESLQSAKQFSQKIEELQADLALRDAQIDDLKKEIAEKDARIEEDEETINEIQQIGEQIELFEGVKNKLEERIRNLKAELKSTKDENEMLKSTIKNNLYSHAQQERDMMQQIEQLKSTKV